jgi:hypothetical protein
VHHIEQTNHLEVHRLQTLGLKSATSQITSHINSRKTQQATDDRDFFDWTAAFFILQAEPKPPLLLPDLLLSAFPSPSPKDAKEEG